jgi:hypothetical protein
MGWGGPPRWPSTRRVDLTEKRSGDWECTLESTLATGRDSATGTGRTKESAEVDAREKLARKARQAEQLAAQRERENRPRRK